MSISHENNLKRKKRANKDKKRLAKTRVDNAKNLYQERLNHMKINEAMGKGKWLHKKEKSNKNLVDKLKALFKRKVKK